MSRPEFDVAWQEINERLRDVTKVPGLDDAAIVSVLLRLAAHLHVKNRMSQASLMALIPEHVYQARLPQMSPAQKTYVALNAQLCNDGDPSEEFLCSLDKAWEALTEIEQDEIDVLLDERTTPHSAA